MMARMGSGRRRAVPLVPVRVHRPPASLPRRDPQVVGYARVSTRDQNPDLQFDALWKAGCIDIFQDVGSGALADRPGLRACLDYLQKGDTLVVWALSRLSRDTHHLQALSRGFEDQGIEFRSLTEQIDTTSWQGRFFYAILAALAAAEREQMLDRTMAGLAAARERGRIGGRPTVLTPAKRKVLVELYEGKQHTLPQIAEVLGVSRTSVVRGLTQHRLEQEAPPQLPYPLVVAPPIAPHTQEYPGGTMK